MNKIYASAIAFFTVLIFSIIFFVIVNRSLEKPFRPPYYLLYNNYNSNKNKNNNRNCSARFIAELLKYLLRLNSKEKKYFSQNNEDGITESLLLRIKPKYWYYVEFGVESCSECNSRFLREAKGPAELGKNWTGLLMDGGYENDAINLHKEMIFPDNIVSLFKKHNVPQNFDLLSVDTDLKDYWLLKEILAAGYRPRVIISEINSFIGPKSAQTVPRNISQSLWDRTKYYGYSVAAGWKLVQEFGYSMVYCEGRGVNCFYVINGKEGFGESGFRVSDVLMPDELWKPPVGLGHWNDQSKRNFTFV